MAVKTKMLTVNRLGITFQMAIPAMAQDKRKIDRKVHTADKRTPRGVERRE